ncbi:MAG: YggS family pyridoxal phosphate-dependent enzyme [Anaerolineae bacterium]
MSQSDLAANLARVQARILQAARRAGRDPDEITLIGVCKTQPVERVIAAYQAGLRHFGENRVEEAELKIPAFHRELPDAGVTWHMIGHIQSRKAGRVLAHFDAIHAVDSLKLAQRLNRLAEAQGLERRTPILLECNVSGEASKFGFNLSNWQTEPDRFDEFKAVIRQIAPLDRVQIQGLMTMAPIVPDPEEARPVFQTLFELGQRLRAEFPDLDWSQLSMGMTDDFEVAIEEGATQVRVGRAIFGPRLIN